MQTQDRKTAKQIW